VTTRVEKPWGHELIWARTERYVGKVMVLRGRMRFEHFRDGETAQTVELEPMQPFHIPPGLRHRMVAVEDTDVLEVSTPELDDVVRLEDRYGRQGT
jgi:mannose-6-phosphate isomerase